MISGYFDHQSAAGLLTFYDGRHSSSGAGFYFSCTNPSMYDWVGCEDAVSGEVACSNNRELWYDGHKGIDYEYSRQLVHRRDLRPRAVQRDHQAGVCPGPRAGA